MSLQSSRSCSPVWLAGLLTAASFFCLLTASQAQTLPGWDLSWADEFSQVDGSLPSPAKWGYDIGNGCPNLCGWGNGELQYYTARTNNARIEGGCLVIEAHEESYEGNSYTSARLVTRDKRGGNWTYGRMEARIKIPRGQGIWPAYWMLGTDFDTVGWPDCGEIDILENIGREPQTVHGTVHGPFSWGGHYASGGDYSNSVDLADDFHVYAVEWQPNGIRWYFDDTQYFTTTPAGVAGEWVFDHSFFFILNIAVGGNWPGPPDETTVFPQQMLVDYVRVYTRVSAAPFSVNAVLIDENIRITFPTQIGLDYQVCFKTNRHEPVWTPIETIPGDGTTKSVTYPTSDPNQTIRFYIVQAL